MAAVNLVTFNKNYMQANDEREDHAEILADKSLRNSKWCYKTPCGVVSIEKIGKGHIVFLFVFAIAMIIYILNYNYFNYQSMLLISRQILTLVGCVLMWFGLKAHQARLFIPFIVINGLWALVMCALVMFILGSGAMDYAKYGKHRINMAFIPFASEQAILYGYVEVVFFKCYKYMKHTEQ